MFIHGFDRSYIASVTGVSTVTIRTHLRHTYHKLGFNEQGLMNPGLLLVAAATNQEPIDVSRSLPK
jgi:hypothetical protein